jgi:hypothetical protein
VYNGSSTRWLATHVGNSRLFSADWNIRDGVKVILQQTVTRSVRLSMKPHLVPKTRLLFLSYCQLHVCWCGAPSLTRGRVFRLQLLLALAGAVIHLFESCYESWLYFFVPNCRLLQFGRAMQPKVLVYPPELGWAELYAQALGSSFIASYLSSSHREIRIRINTGVSLTKKSKTVTLRPTVSRPVRLGARRPSGTRDQFFFLLEIFFRQLRVCYFVAPSLARGRVCNLLLLLVLASALPLGSALSDERSDLSFVSISLESVSMYIRYL